MMSTATRGSDRSHHPAIHWIIARPATAHPGVIADGGATVGAAGSAMLPRAGSQARVALAAGAAGIAVSFVADTGAVVRLPAVGEGVVIEQQQDGGMLWAEARWDSR